MKSQLTQLITGLVVALVAIPAIAQDEENTGGIVAVLDVAKVFKENASFNTQMESIKSQAERLKAEIQADQEAIRKDAMKLQEYEVGSADRNRLEADLEQRQAGLRTRARQSEQDLLNREATVYYDTYKQMQKVVANIAKQYSITLVLRFDSADIDKTSRPEVIKGVNRAVVYHHQLDLTKMVITAMTGQAENRPAGNAGTTKR